MIQLTKREEEILQILWTLKQAFVKDIIKQMPETPKPHYNTVSTLVRLMEEKGLVGHKAVGGSHQYFAILQKEDYKKSIVPKLIRNYFDNSYKSMVSFFAEDEKLSAEDLKEILDLIEQPKNKSKS